MHHRYDGSVGRDRLPEFPLAHTEPGPFVNEMLGDRVRWTEEGVLSIMVQDTPVQPHEPTPLRVLDFTVGVQR